MIKKISDISLPKKEKEEIKVSPQKIRAKRTLPKIRFFKRPSKNFLVFLFLIILGIFVFLGSLKFSKVKIEIWPKEEEIKLKEKITVDTSIENPDFQNKLIRGDLIEKEETISEQFPATGNFLKKAEGTIRVFNEYSTQDEIWREGTRFVSSEGKVFKSKNKIQVPGAKIKNGKIEPSFVDVPVEALEGGSEYNIPPSDFSIVAFKGSPRYFKFYGKSFVPMQGGGKFPQVKKEDLENAEKILVEKTKEKAKEILKSEISPEFLFDEGNISIEILEKNFSAKEGEVVDKFNFSVKFKIKTIVFKKEDLLQFSKRQFISQLVKEKEMEEKSLKVDYKAEVLKLDLGKIDLSLDIVAKVYPKIDFLQLKKGLAGKKVEETKIFLLSKPEVSKVKINLFPFWINRIPEDMKRIEIFYSFID